MFKLFSIKDFLGSIKETISNAFNTDYQPKSIIDCLILGSIDFILLGIGLFVIYGFSVISNFQSQVSPFMKFMLFSGYIRYFGWYAIWKFKQINNN